LCFHGYIHESIKWLVEKRNLQVNLSESFISTKNLSLKIYNEFHVGLISYVAKDSNFKCLSFASGQFAECMRCYVPVIIIGNDTLCEYVKSNSLGIWIENFEDLPKVQEEIRLNYNFYLQNIQEFNKHYNLEKYTKEIFDLIC
jgi:hypothetical protein